MRFSFSLLCHEYIHGGSGLSHHFLYLDTSSHRKSNSSGLLQWMENGSMAKIHEAILDNNARLREIVKCAIMHSQGITHKEISYERGISSPTVTRHIQRAEDLGIIRIEVFLPRDVKTAEKLEETYGLREAWVFPIGIEEELTDMLAGLAAAYLEKLLDEGDEEVNRIAIGSGRTPLAFVKALSNKRRPEVKVASASSASFVETHIASNILIGIPAGKWECELYRFDPDMPREDQIDYADVSFFGVGRIQDMEGVTARALRSSEIGLSESDVERELGKLVGQGGVGIINYQPIDEEGSPLTWDLKEYKDDLRPTVLELDVLKEIAEDEKKRVICIAGGARKVRAIRAALKGGYFNVLITDYATAATLLEPDE